MVLLSHSSRGAVLSLSQHTQVKSQFSANTAARARAFYTTDSRNISKYATQL
jgi:hypothetical protein